VLFSVLYLINAKAQLRPKEAKIGEIVLATTAAYDC